MTAVYNRRLPVYLLLDCSESLAGEPLEAVAQGVAALLADLRGDPMAVETVYLSVITFAGRAAEAVPLTELMKFQPPKLRLGSGTALGAALRLLVDALNRDVVKTTANQKGDWKPVVLILTDGGPTDDWKAVADTVRTQVCGARASVIAVACGPDADPDTLRRITPTVLKAADLQPGTLMALFKWVSASVSVASARLEAAPATGLGLPPLPAGKVELAGAGGRPVDPDRFVFLHARCGKGKQFYLIRYQKADRRGYEAVSAHQAPDFDLAAGGGAAPTVSASQLGPPPDCPYCRNETLSVCDCGKLFCAPRITRPMTLHCPWCGQGGSYAPGASGDIGRGAG